jgi:hypothetical protein
MNNAYTIERTEHGILIKGSVPLQDMPILKVFSKQGYKEMAIGVASALGATMALCEKGGAEKWKAAIDAQAKQSYADPLRQWLHGSQVGTSSLTLAYGLTREQAVLAALRGHSRGDIPYDPADFGRCYNLLEQVPGLRERIGEMTKAFSFWRPYVDNWQELETLWLEESPSGRCPKLYDRMKELQVEADKIKRSIGILR